MFIQIMAVVVSTAVKTSASTTTDDLVDQKAVLFCGAETQLIAIIKTPDPDPNFHLRNTHPGVFRFLLLSAYSTFLLNASATISCAIMMNRIRNLPVRALKLRQVGKLPSNPGGVRIDYIIEDYGAGSQWTWMKWHCESSAPKVTRQ